MVNTTIPRWMEVMNEMLKGKNEITLTQLSKKLEIDPKNTYEYIKGLEDRGLIRREIKDKRKLIFLTEPGKDIARECNILLSKINKC